MEIINPEALPAGPLIGWLGDDFTGASAVLEVLTFAGLPSVLFLESPSAEDLKLFPNAKGIGIASTTRTMSCSQITQYLPRAIKSLSELNLPLLHYKVCTTLDSSPHIGSIGHALEEGSRVLNAPYVPVLIAAPTMRRYQCFGHLYASFGDGVYRLDEHPVMSTHPVTPMDESNVALHLNKQTTNTQFDNITLEQLKLPDLTLENCFDQLNTDAAALTIDCMNAQDEETIGRLLWSERRTYPFVVGSQGVEYALVRYWQSQDLLEQQPNIVGIGEADRIAVISGSVSNVTAKQIAWARDNGFCTIKFDPSTACEKEHNILEEEVERCYQLAVDALATGQSPIIYTAEGIEDASVSQFNQKLSHSGIKAADANRQLGEALGRLLIMLIEHHKLRRVVISGGDTSGYATGCLDIFALTVLAPTIPGAPIFKAHSRSNMDGLEIALKGGQMGTEDYFSWVKKGGGPQ